MASSLIQIPPPPEHLRKDPVLYRWLQDIARLFAADGGVSPDQISFVDVSLSDLGSRKHSELTNIQSIDGAGGVLHLTQTQWNALVAVGVGQANTLTSLQNQINSLTTRMNSVEARLTLTEAATATNTADIVTINARLAAAGIP